ncbi:MAG: hypothetical protein HGB01_01885 [Chlorobiaceae bacterium]|nr:hypothetical protein [Chlorobiaceae bacterium]
MIVNRIFLAGPAGLIQVDGVFGLLPALVLLLVVLINAVAVLAFHEGAFEIIRDLDDAARDGFACQSAFVLCLQDQIDLGDYSWNWFHFIGSFLKARADTLWVWLHDFRHVPELL